MRFLLALLCLYYSGTPLWAQSGLLLEPDSMFFYDQNADLSNEWMNYGLYMDMSNVSGDTLLFVWERMLSANCPEEWDFAVSDHNATYVPQVSMSPEGFHIVLLPQVLTYFGVDVWPRSVPGCCTVHVPFTDLNNPDLILGTAYFDIILNSDCSPSKVNSQRIESMEISIFPNPAQKEVWVGGKATFQFKIYNSLGLPVKSGMIDSESERSVSLAALPSGIYLAHFFDPLNNRQQILKLVKS